MGQKGYLGYLRLCNKTNPWYHVIELYSSQEDLAKNEVRSHVKQHRIIWPGGFQAFRLR
jgi:hypothetical protein